MVNFQSDHPLVHHWIVTNLATSSYARACLKAISRGTISDRQIARVEHMVACEKRRNRDRSGARLTTARDAIIAMTRNVEPR